ncbi:MAG: hypothetical protein Q7Q73_06895 [Verrucomicrobiota bacterium JB024]|nr:hypothetical protein [Verrucomicrobiota bacterium JB024]
MKHSPHCKSHCFASCLYDGRSTAVRSILAGCALAALTFSTATAANVAWTNNGSDWGTSTNWSPNDVPDTNADIATITSPTVNPDIGTSDYTIKTLNFGPSTGSFSIDGSGTLTLDANNASSANVVFMGPNNASIEINPSVIINNSLGGRSLLSIGSGSLSFQSQVSFGGTVQQTSGTVNFNNTLSLGSGSNYQITEGGTMNLNLASSGSTGNASALLWAQNGSINVYSLGDLGSTGAQLRVGSNTASSANLILKSSGLQVGNAVAVQGGTSATGVVSIGADIDGAGQAEYTGSVDLNNFGSSNRVIKLTAGTDDTTSFSGNLTNTAAPDAGSEVQVAGGGTVVLSGDGNTYSIDTRVTENTSLLVENSGLTSATGTGDVTVDEGSLLGGNGRVSGLVTAAGSGSVISAGNESMSGGVGTLSMAGGFDAASGASFVFDLNGASGDDQIAVDGSFSGGSSGWVFYFDNLGEGTLAAGEEVTIVIASGGFDGVTAADFDSAIINYSGGLSGADFGIYGNELRVSFASVPEPGYSALAVVGFVVLAGLRRFRARR